MEKSVTYAVVEKIIHLEDVKLSYLERLLVSLRKAKRISAREHEALLALAWMIMNSNM